MTEDNMTPKSEETDTARVEDMIAVPRDLLAAACHCIRKYAGVQSETYRRLSVLSLSDRLAQASPSEEVRGVLIRVARMIPGVICADGVSDAFLASIPDELAHYRLEPSAASAGVRDAGREALQAQEDAEDARDTCECEGEGPWEHCGPCSERFGRAIILRRGALVIRNESGEAATLIETDANGEAMVCTGCGTTRTVAAIRASSPTAFTCCPERKMIPVRAALTARPDGKTTDALPTDVRRLVIAARVVTDAGYDDDEMSELFDAVEAFSARVPYEDEPDATTATGGADREAEIARLREALERARTDLHLIALHGPETYFHMRQEARESRDRVAAALDTSAAKEAGR